MRRMSSFRSQSAMEYLMTYGWSILIIAVVLGVLFQLGVFGGANFLPKAQAGGCKVFRATGIASLQGICSSQVPQYVAQFYGYVNVGNPSILILGNSGTISAWIKPSVDSLTNIHVIYGTSGGADLNKVPYFRIEGGSLAAYVGDGSTLQRVGSNLHPTANVWQFVALTWNGVTVSMYLNNPVYSTPQTNTMTFTGNGYQIGAALPFYPQRDFNGLISNFQIYNTSLDVNQIKALYMEGIGGAPIDPYHIVGWWPINGDTNDYSGNNNGGTPTNVIFIGSWS